MKALIIYDSKYGNTEKIANAIGSTINGKVLHVNDVKLMELDTCELLIVGSPVHGGRPTPAIQSFLSAIPTNSLKGKHVAAFDTRFEPEDHGVGLRILMYVIRFAAERIAHVLKQRGGKLVGRPEGFIVEDKEGPLKNGELERANLWTRQLLEESERIEIC